MQESASTGKTAPAELVDRRKQIYRVTWIGLLTNLVLAAVKMAAGFIGNSQAVFADGIHSLSDSVTDVAVLLGAQYWDRPPDDNHPYGHKRIETLVTIFIGVVLLVAGFGIGWEAITSFHHSQHGPPGLIALWAALASLIFKEALYRWTIAVGRKVKSPATLANAWHHRLDAVSSIPALAAVAGARIFPEWSFLDRIGALCVSVLIIQAALKIIWPGLRELTDAGADEEICLQIESLTLGTPRVVSAHAIRTRYVGNHIHVDMKIHVDGRMSVTEGHEVAARVKSRIMGSGLGVMDVVVHVEPDDGRQDAAPACESETAHEPTPPKAKR